MKEEEQAAEASRTRISRVPLKKVIIRRIFLCSADRASRYNSIE